MKTIHKIQNVIAVIAWGMSMHLATQLEITTKETISAVIMVVLTIVISIKGVKESFIRPEEKYLTIKEVAKKLHVDPSTLWSWDKRGYLRKIEVGGKRLYRESDIEAILNRK